MVRVSTEKGLEQSCRRLAKRHGALLLKLTGYRGIPDRLLLQGSVATFVEFKKPGGTVARAQLNWRSRLRKKGFRAEILDSRQEFLGLLTSTSSGR